MQENGDGSQQKLPPITSASHRLYCDFCKASSAEALSDLSTVNNQYRMKYDHYSAADGPQFYTAWRLAIKQYCSLRLTYTKDIFPALSGMAHMWRSTYQSKYYAGLWEKTLIHDLLWYRERWLTGHRAPWRAPSWSWASLLSPQYAHRSLDQAHENSHILQHTSIDAVHCKTDDPDWAGELRSAFITITCHSIIGTIHCGDKTDRRYNLLPFVNSDTFCLEIDDIVLRRRVHLDFEIEEWEDTHPEMEVRLLALAVTTFDPEPRYVETNDVVPLWDHPVQCLVVRKKPGVSASDVYERVGYAYLHPDEVEPETLECVRNEPREGEADKWSHERENVLIWGIPQPGMSVSRWRYDMHCRITRLIRESALRQFTVV